jgi:hypothetical protein
MQKKLIENINNSFNLAIPEQAEMKELHNLLSGYINQLIEKDFQRLIQLLYRIDVNETKLRQILKENPDKDAAPIISDLIIERQTQKINSRKQAGRPDSDEIDENEKW